MPVDDPTQQLIDRVDDYVGNRPGYPAARIEFLGHDPGFHSMAGRAQATTPPDRSVDMVTAFQAFHWFNLDAVQVEFAASCGQADGLSWR
jgi:hypothetical protein